MCICMYRYTHPDCWLQTSVSRVLCPLGSRLAHSCQEAWGIRRSSTGLAWYCPSLLTVHDWMMVAQKFLTVNTWQLVAWGTHLVQVLIIGLLSLRPADRRTLTYHPVFGEVLDFPSQPGLLCSENGVRDGGVGCFGYDAGSDTGYCPNLIPDLFFLPLLPVLIN